jgi:hypothetical protein
MGENFRKRKDIPSAAYATIVMSPGCRLAIEIAIVADRGDQR